MAHGTHDFEDDPRNEHIQIWINGELVPRHRAVVSVFDAGFVQFLRKIAFASFGRLAAAIEFLEDA